MASLIFTLKKSFQKLLLNYTGSSFHSLCTHLIFPNFDELSDFFIFKIRYSSPPQPKKKD